MKGSCTLVASVLAASTVAFTSSSAAGDRDAALNLCSIQGSCSMGKNNASSSCMSLEKEKFAPRFDGLRFIETLVTGHR